MYIKQLPSDYKHPSGLNMAGYFGLFDGKTAILIAKEVSGITEVIPHDYHCEKCGHVFLSGDAAITQETDSSEYAGTVEWSTVNVVCCPECGSDELEQLS